tara:strand:- start:967 stop:1293 length:327 start_codon:yes stop_codon:yes gene_type:complete
MIGEKSAVWLGGVALVFSIIAYVLGSAAFHPAMVLTYASAPIAFLAYLFGASRLPILAVYFSVMAWFVVPLSKALPVRIDYLLALCFVSGCILGVFLYANYRHSRAAT